MNSPSFDSEQGELPIEERANIFWTDGWIWYREGRGREDIGDVSWNFGAGKVLTGVSCSYFSNMMLMSSVLKGGEREYRRKRREEKTCIGSVIAFGPRCPFIGHLASKF
jgi:hypothetical protein